mmetsp:Transcript_7513/g.15081  ORF Transcript_7513/g.15081 Transcript_7513/m.15081 type:complete len:286 (+) Transcript_7513:130-987(+)
MIGLWRPTTLAQTRHLLAQTPPRVVCPRLFLCPVIKRVRVLLQPLWEGDDGVEELRLLREEAVQVRAHLLGVVWIEGADALVHLGCLLALVAPHEQRRFVVKSQHVVRVLGEHRVVQDPRLLVVAVHLLVDESKHGDSVVVGVRVALLGTTVGLAREALHHLVEEVLRPLKVPHVKQHHRQVVDRLVKVWLHNDGALKELLRAPKVAAPVRDLRQVGQAFVMHRVSVKHLLVDRLRTLVVLVHMQLVRSLHHLFQRRQLFGGQVVMRGKVTLHAINCVLADHLRF